LHLYVAAEGVPVLGLHAELVPDDALCHLEELDRFGVDFIDEGISLKESDGGLHIHFAGITLASQIELNHWD